LSRDREQTVKLFPHSEFSRSEDRDIFTEVRIRHYSQSVLSSEAWFRTANKLIAAMDLLQSNVHSFWESLGDLVLDPKTNETTIDEKTNPTVKHSLVNQHMMLAGFAIENLCKGHLANQLSDEERKAVQERGVLPKSLRCHDALNLLEQTGMTVSDTEKSLLNRITEAVLWRGRYPSAISHESLRPFAQMESDIDRINSLLQKLRRHVGAED
jgi:hypothetical protein